MKFISLIYPLIQVSIPLNNALTYLIFLLYSPLFFLLPIETFSTVDFFILQIQMLALFLLSISFNNYNIPVPSPLHNLPTITNATLQQKITGFGDINEKLISL